MTQISGSLCLQFHYIFEKQKANLPWSKKTLARMILLVQKTPELEPRVVKIWRTDLFCSVEEMGSEASKRLRKEYLLNRTFWDDVNVLYLHCPIQWPLATCGFESLKCGYITEGMNLFIIQVKLKSSHVANGYYIRPRSSARTREV